VSPDRLRTHPVRNERLVSTHRIRSPLAERRQQTVLRQPGRCRLRADHRQVTGTF